MLKQCSKCKQNKSTKEFYFSDIRAGFLSSNCKLCDINKRKTNRKNNPVKYSIADHKRYLRRKNDWLNFFNNHYTTQPTCQICNKALTWKSKTNGNAHDTVNWDHRNTKSLSVKFEPSKWLTSHNCSSNNQILWLSFEFGILCGTCNQFLPTNNREEWLIKALEYAKRMECDLLD